MKSSEDDLPPATPRTRPITRSSVARPLSPTTAIPPFTPPQRRHISRINVTPHHGGTPAPEITAPSTLAFANPNYYEPINDDIIDEPPPGGELHMSSQNSPGNSPSLLTPPSPREDHNNDDNPPLGTPIPTTMTAEFQEGFATAPDFLAPADFGNPALIATTTRVLESSPPTLTDLDRILAAISGINVRFDGVTAHFDALGDRLQAFESLSPCLDALDERVKATDGILCDLDKRVTHAESLLASPTWMNASR
jgi:hypothetical protein